MRRLILTALLLVAAAVSAPATAQAQNRFWLVNESGRTITHAYVSSSRVSNWGPDILGAGVVVPGDRVWVTPMFSDCMLDVRVRFENGAEEQRRNVDACSLSRIVFGGRAPGAGAGAGVSGSRGSQVDPDFNFVNGSPYVIRELYISLSTDRGWGADRLGSSTLPSGASWTINLPQGIGCLVDIRVVYMNGQASERRGVETCSLTRVVWR